MCSFYESHCFTDCHSQQAKAQIRRILPVGLSESISKVRSSVAYAVSAIAHWDWPEQWPELFPLLMQGLTSGQPDAVHGAMRVLSGLCRFCHAKVYKAEFSFTQIIRFAKDMELWTAL